MNLRQIKIGLSIGLGILGLLLCNYLYIESKKERLKTEINDNIDSILQGKKMLMDGQNSYDVRLKQDAVPYDGVTPQYEGIKRYYTLINGGFNFYVLERVSQDVFDVYNLTSTDLGYKKEDFDWFESNSTHFRECYKYAFDFFIDGHPKYKNAFVAGSTETIQQFGALKNRYYQIAELDKNSFGFQNSGHPCVSNDYVNLFYKTSGEKYTIEIINSNVIWDYIIYTVIELIILGILSFVFLYKPRIKEAEKEKEEDEKIMVQ